MSGFEAVAEPSAALDDAGATAEATAEATADAPAEAPAAEPASSALEVTLGKWMWADAGLSVGSLRLNALSAANPLRWSRVKALSAIVTELEEVRGDDRFRPVLIEFVDEHTQTGLRKLLDDATEPELAPRRTFASVDQAIEHVGKVDVAALRRSLLDAKHAEFARVAGPDAIAALASKPRGSARDEL